MKTRQNNKVANRTSEIYIKNETKLSWLIRLCMIYDEGQIGQCHDWSYSLVYVKTETELLEPIQPGEVCEEN